MKLLDCGFFHAVLHLLHQKTRLRAPLFFIRPFAYHIKLPEIHQLRQQPTLHFSDSYLCFSHTSQRLHRL